MRFIALVLFVCLLPVASFAAGPVTGTKTVCVGSTTVLTDASPGGTWSSSNTAIASVDATGTVTGIGAGIADIAYTDGAGAAVASVTVNPTPVMTSTLTPPAICYAKTFNYAPTGSEPGTAFAWSRATLYGIIEVGTTGTDNPNEQLINTTYAPIEVPYVYTLTLGGCTSTKTVTVVTNPAVKLSSPANTAVCGGDLFTYAPTSMTPGATFAWSRAGVAGILQPSAHSTGTISETLTNTTSSPINVTYKLVLAAFGCTNTVDEIMTLKVYSLPCTLGLPQAAATKPSSVYPNPNTGAFTLYIAAPKTESVIVTITNVVGEKVKEITATTNTDTDIQLSVPAGVYMLSAGGGIGRYYSRVVVN